MATNDRQQIRDYIENDLPESFGAGTISEMYADLQRDLDFIKTKKGASIDQKKMEMMLHHRHKKFAFSYPGLFFKIVREEVDPVMLNRLLTLKENMDKQDISLDEARNRVIDCAKHQIEEAGDRPRAKKAKPPGTVVQELSFKCKPDDF